eukprot:gene23886-biopygen18395
MEEADAAFRAANRECRRSATADLAAFQESEARCLQEAYEDRHTRVVFNKINVLTGRTRAAPIASIKSPTGASTPTIEQVMKAIQKLKNTAPGNCAVTAQMLKLGGHAVASRLHKVISVTWASGRCPQSWKEATLTYIYKGKEDKLLPDNYRGISLLSVCSKVYTNVLIDRLKPTIEPTLHEAQWRAPLFAAFVDYRKAFDSVNREAMWTLMAARGVDPHLVSLVKEISLLYWWLPVLRRDYDYRYYGTTGLRDYDYRYYGTTGTTGLRLPVLRLPTTGTTTTDYRYYDYRLPVLRDYDYRYYGTTGTTTTGTTTTGTTVLPVLRYYRYYDYRYYDYRYYDYDYRYYDYRYYDYRYYGTTTTGTTTTGTTVPGTTTTYYRYYDYRYYDYRYYDYRYYDYRYYD